MARKTIGIDIGNDYIHVVEGSYSAGNVEVFNAFTARTPQNAFLDGKIEELHAMEMFLAGELKAKNISSKNTAITIQGSNFITRDLVINAEKPEYLDSLVHFKMAEYLTGDIDNYIIEFTVIGEQVTDGAKSYKVRAAAMPRDIVLSWYNLLERLNLKPVMLDIHTNAFSKILYKNMNINGKSLSDKAVVFIDIGSRSTVVYITEGGALELSRSIGIGVRDFIYAAAGGDIMNEENELLKTMNLENASDDKVLRPLVNQWTSEIQKICQYYTTRMNGKSISDIYIYGGGADISGVEALIKNTMSVETQKIKSVSSILFLDKAVNSSPLYFLNAAGALISGKRG